MTRVALGLAFLVAAGCPATEPPADVPLVALPDAVGDGLVDAEVSDARGDATEAEVAEVGTIGDSDAGTDGVPNDGPPADGLDLEVADASNLDTVVDAATDTSTDAPSTPDASDAEVDTAGSDVIGTVCVTPGDPCIPEITVICQEGRCNEELECENVQIEGCCYFDKDCDLSQSQGCFDMRCIQQNCTLLTIPGCCDAGVSCADGQTCTTESCIAGRCQRCPTDDCTCAANPVLTQQGFGSVTTLNEAGFFATDYNSGDNVMWSVDSERWSRPPGALYLGDPLCRTYFNGALGADCQPVIPDGSDAGPVRLLLYTPSINLTAGVASSGAGKVALFSLWSDVEDVAGPADAITITVDEISGAFVSWPVASTADAEKDTDGQWRVVAIDLAPFEGKVIRMKLDFDTIDGLDNLHEGVYLDDWQVVDRCAGGGCCQTDADCTPLSDDPCLAARCVTMLDGGGNVCATVAANPGEPCQTCSTAVDCEDGNPCTEDVCTPAGICQSTTFCCFEQSVFTASFDDGNLVGWSLFDDQVNDNVQWQPSSLEAVDGTAALWCGDAASGTYETGGPVTTTARTPAFTLPETLEGPGVIAAEFWVNLETEWPGGGYDNPLGIDRLSASLVTSNGSVELWSSDAIGGTTGGSWVPVNLDLSLWAGNEVQLEFRFDTVDGSANAFAGPFIDQLVVGRTCP